MIRAIIVFMALFLVIGIMFIALSTPIAVVYEEALNLTNTMLVNTTLRNRTIQSQEFIYNMWWLAPFVMLIALIVWLFVQAQRREYEYYPGG